jgi:hypothetical protein
MTRVLEFEAGPARLLSKADEQKVIVCCGAGPVRIEAPGDLPQGQVTDVLQWNEAAVATTAATGGARLTALGPMSTRGRSSMLRILAVAPGDYAVVAFG